MPTSDKILQRGQLSGNVDAPVLTYPTLRGYVRRNDPDMVRSFPYFTSLTGTSMVVGCRTAPVGGALTSITINFTSDGYTDAINTINAASPGDIKAYDDAGFLVIQSLHGGGKNSLEILSGAAAPILGFDYNGLTGISKAGDLATSSSGGSNQSNPPGTKLVSHDENFQSAIVNRAIMGAVQGLDQMVFDLDREIAVYRILSLTLGAGSSFNIASSFNIRLATDMMTRGFSLDHIQVFDSGGNAVYVSDTRVRVTSVTYGALINPLAAFATWGTPDGKSVASPQNNTGLKVALTAITSIKGNVIVATGALFVTNNVQAKDVITIQSATNTTPFDHNGQYVVIAVVDENTIVVRAMGTHEDFSGEDKPRALNANKPGGTNYGNVGVYIGNFVPTTMKNSGAGNDQMYFNMNESLSPGTYLIALPVGQSVREMGTNSIVAGSSTPSGTPGMLPIHIKDPDIAYKSQQNIFKYLNHFDQKIQLGESNASSNAGAMIERILHTVAPTATTKYTLLQVCTINGGGGAIMGRTYANVTAAGYHLVTTANCYWDQSLSAGAGGWSKDTVGTAALKVEIDAADFNVYSVAAGVTTWPDSVGGPGWVQNFNLDTPTATLTMTGMTVTLSVLNAAQVNATNLSVTGQATIAQLLLEKAAVTDRNAVLQGIDSDGAGHSYVRYQLDHLGYPMHRLVIFDEQWFWDSATSGATGVADGTAFLGGRWELKCSAGANGSWIAAWADPIAANSFTLHSTNVNNLATWLRNRAYIFPLPGSGARNNTVLVCEYEVNINAANASNFWLIGFFDDNGAGADPQNSTNASCWLQVTGVGTYKLKTLGGGLVDTHVTPTWGSFDRVRIEIHGSASPFGLSVGGSVVTNVFINGVYVAESITSVVNLFTAGKFGFYSKNTGTPPDNWMTVGPVRIVWNRFDTLPNL